MKKKSDRHTRQTVKRDKQVDRYKSLVDIGRALSSEKEISGIIDLVLDKALETTDSDAVSIYLTEQIRIDSIGNASRKFHTVLRYHRSASRASGKISHNKVLEIDGKSIAGYVAMTGNFVRLEDCYAITADSQFHFNPEMDNENKYHTKSMLAIPIQTSEGKIRGVLQLINKLRPGSRSFLEPIVPEEKDIIPFNDHDEELMRVFASQTCSAIENAKLTEDIENLFESFIRASVTAIESRDPSTSGHSDRVAVLTVELARAAHFSQTGPYASLKFSDQHIREIRYAALLHDFGKIGVREQILVKEKKLYPHEMESILMRLDAARTKQEMLLWKEMATELVEQFEKGTLEGPRFKLHQLNKKIENFSKQMQQVRLSILKANQPQIVKDDFDIAQLMTWINQTSNEIQQMVLTPDEIIRLSLPKGSLNEDERREIESHVSHTYQFLRQIAWTEDLSNVADIAHAHHEKCDGTGYPRGLTSEHIPVQAKMMTIADIYDALTSMDRPYKPATSPERAVEILHFEAKEGKLDIDLLQIFVEAEVYRSVMGMLSRPSKKVA